MATELLYNIYNVPLTLYFCQLYLTPNSSRFKLDRRVYFVDFRMNTAIVQLS
jgi:hypothetical protein